jgi:DHA1 family inner membrane transport protein
MLIGDTAGWRWTMALVVAFGVCSMVALATRARSLPVLDSGGGAPVFSVLRSAKTGLGVLSAFLLGIASLGLYTYLLPMAESRGLGDWGFALVWAWGIGGVGATALIGRPLDRVGPRPFLIALPVILALGFAVAWLSGNPVAWIIAAVLWGAAGWATVPTLQQALTADRPAQAMPVIAFQMAAMYLGSAVGCRARKQPAQRWHSGCGPRRMGVDPRPGGAVVGGHGQPAVPAGRGAPSGLQVDQYLDVVVLVLERLGEP